MSTQSHQPANAGSPIRATAAAPRIRVRARCPLCAESIETLAGETPVELTCGACGMHFTHECSPRPVNGGQGGAAGTLDRWLAGEPIHPKQLSDWQRLRRWCGRHAVLSTAVSLVAALLVLSALGAGLGYAYTSVRLKQLAAARERAEEQRQVAQELAEHRAKLAARRQRQIEAERRQVETQRRERLAIEDQLRRTEEQRLEAERRRRIVEGQQLQTARRARLALARQLADDSRQLLATHPYRALFLARESIRARQREGLQIGRGLEQIVRDALAAVGPHGLRGHSGPILDAAVSPEGHWLATAGADSTVRLWNLWADSPDQACHVLRGHQGPVSALAMTPEGKWLASAGHDGRAMLWNLRAEDPSAAPIVLRGHQGRINAATISPDGQWLITAGGGANASRQAGGHPLDDGAGGGENVARLWNLAAVTGARVAGSPGLSEASSADTSTPADANPHGMPVASMPAASRAPITLRGHRRPILTVAVSANSRWLATAGEDKTIRLWNLAARRPAAEQIVLRGHEGWVDALAVSPDNRWLASGSYDNTVRLWKLSAIDPGADPTVLRGHEGWVGTVAISPDGRWLASGSFDKTVRVWDLQAESVAESSRVLQGHQARVQQLAFSPDGRWLVSGSYDRTARLWDVSASDPVATARVLRGHVGPVNTLALSGDGKWLITGSGETFNVKDNTARLWDLELGTLLETAGAVADEELSAEQRREMLLEAAKRSETLQ